VIARLPVGRAPASRVLLHALNASVVLFTLLLVLPGDAAGGFFRDIIVGNLVYVLCTAVLLRRGWEVRTDRIWLWCLAGATTAFLVGNLLYLLWLPTTDGQPFPSWADAGYLAVLPFIASAVPLSMRHRLGRLRRSVALDGLVAALATTTVAAWVVAPLTGSYTGSLLEVAVATAHPVGDVLVLAMAVGVLGVVGVRAGSLYLSVATGLGTFAVADTIAAYRVMLGSFEVGTPLDALWAIGFAIVVNGACRAASHRPERVAVGTASLWVVSVSAVAAVSVLSAASWHAAPHAVAVLGTATLLGCGVRTFEAFRRVQELAAVRRQAMTDDLTDLANRRALYAATEQALAERHDEAVVGLLLVDLDRFKDVNDSLGHSAGDELLKVVAERISTVIKHRFPLVTAARLGGDEFALLLPSAVSSDEVLDFASLVGVALDGAVIVDGVAVHVRSSIGVAVAPEHADNRSELLRCADVAMYTAKPSGGGVAVFDPGAGELSREHLELVDDVHRAVRGGQLTVHYQPKVDLQGQPVGAEALVRWIHPVRGFVPPDRFLPIAEEHHLMPLLTQQVLDTAVADCAAWRGERPELGVSVNVSASDLLDPFFAAWVADALARHDLPGTALTVEITESVVMTDPEKATEALTGLRRLGVQVAIDDYGTGQSSLDYLRRLPVQELKLDRTFVSDMATNPTSAAIVDTTIRLAHALGLRMVAEGVEDARTVQLLVATGCDLAQGWHWAKALPLADFLEWCEAQAEVSGSLVAPR